MKCPSAVPRRRCHAASGSGSPKCGKEGRDVVGDFAFGCGRVDLAAQHRE